MRFCQVDGSALVDDAPAFDPYATIVAPAMPVPPIEPEPVAAAPETPVEMAVEPVSSSPVGHDPNIHATVGSIPIAEPSEVLDLPSSDPLKTMYVSEAEMKDVLGVEEGNNVVEIPPATEVSEPEPPSFLAPEPVVESEPEPVVESVPEPEPVVAAPPPSPFSTPSEPAPMPDFSVPEPGVSEPEPAPTFDAPANTSPIFEEPKRDFGEAATVIQPSFQMPFDPAPAAPVAEWTPPPPPEANWQNQDVGSNTPFQPPPAGTEGQNKTLAIISLVAGILGMTICCGSFVISVVAIVTGFMARGKANSDPGQYGGAGMALGGIITGALGLVLSVLFMILYLAGAIAGNMGNF